MDQITKPTSKRGTRLRLLSRSIIVTATSASTRKRGEAVRVGAATKTASAITVACAAWVLELAIIFSRSVILCLQALIVLTSEFALSLLVKGTDNHVVRIGVGKVVEWRARKM
jgi:hypothetical protein